MLKDKRCFFLDLDGCVYVGDTPVPGARDAIAHLRRAGKTVWFLTNNSSKTPQEYAKKLGSMGIEAKTGEVITSGVATAKHLRKSYGGLKVMVLGAPALAEVLSREGHTIVNSHHESEALVVGLDLDFTYTKLSEAMRAVLEGAMFFATNTDPTLPTESGLLPGAGAMVAAVQISTGVNPFVVGKPNNTIFQTAMELCNTTPGESVFVGDRLDTDVVGAKRVGAFAVLVLSGVTSVGRLESVGVDPQRRPDLIVQDLSQLVGHV